MKSSSLVQSENDQTGAAEKEDTQSNAQFS